MNSSKLPVFYISHGGGPCFWMKTDPPDLWAGLAASLKDIPRQVGVKPKAILVVSAHWIESEFTLQTSLKPTMLYDYGGFPPETYQLQYPAPGSMELVKRIEILMSAANIPFKEDAKRGFDHGLFVPLLMMYPEADIPVIQLSIKTNYSPKEHLELGRVLEPLRSEGVLIVGSGFSYHARFNDQTEASKPFDDWLNETLCKETPNARYEKVLHWENAPGARVSQPEEDHLIPLMLAVGASGDDAGTRIYNEKMKRIGIYSSSFRFG